MHLPYCLRDHDAWESMTCRAGIPHRAASLTRFIMLVTRYKLRAAKLPSIDTVALLAGNSTCGPLICSWLDVTMGSFQRSKAISLE